jgi:hypothetical protein
MLLQASKSQQFHKGQRKNKEEALYRIFRSEVEDSIQNNWNHIQGKKKLISSPYYT